MGQVLQTMPRGKSGWMAVLGLGRKRQVGGLGTRKKKQEVTQEDLGSTFNYV